MGTIIPAIGQFASIDVLIGLILGCVWGTIAGVLPGMGTVSALIVALPFAFNL